MMVRERRRCFRAPLEVPVTMLRASGVVVKAHSVNLSEGGMAITSSAGFSVGEYVKVTAQLPGGPLPISIHAEVCWTKDDRCGLQFCGVSAKVQATIQGWLADRLDATLPESHVSECHFSEASNPEHGLQRAAFSWSHLNASFPHI